MIKKNFNRIKYLATYLALFLPLGLVRGTDVVIPVTLKNPIAAESFEALVTAILEVVVAIGTPIAILAIIYSGFLFVKAQGKPEALKTAREALIWTIVGVAVLLGARLLATVIQGTITGLGA
jgi:hypothetical protein